LRPIIDRFITNYSVDLYSCVLDESRREVSLVPHCVCVPVPLSLSVYVSLSLSPSLCMCPCPPLPLCVATSHSLPNLRVQVNARWRMVGTLSLPWRPKIDLVGNTRFRCAQCHVVHPKSSRKLPQSFTTPLSLTPVTHTFAP
jgi:hypothetical protein